MGIPKNIVIIWSGAINEIPEKWFLCDGQNGTPNLRNKFIVGGGNLYSLDQTGGSSNVILPSHTHTGSTNTFSHAHTGLGGQLSGGFFGSINGRNVKTQGTTGNGGHSHSELTSSTIGEADGTGRNIPPYYALAYIMYGGN